MNRAVAIEMLKRMGRECNPDWADEKLGRRVLRAVADGMPADATDQERALVDELNEAIARPAKPDEDEAAVVDGPKPKKGKKAPKTDKPAKPAKKVKAPKEDQPKGTRKRGCPPNSPRKGSGAFRAIFEKHTEIRRDRLIDLLVERGEVTPATAGSYITWAKRNTTDVNKNPFGMVLESFKNDKGEKCLRLIGKPKGDKPVKKAKKEKADKPVKKAKKAKAEQPVEQEASAS